MQKKKKGSLDETILATVKAMWEAIQTAHGPYSGIIIPLNAKTHQTTLTPTLACLENDDAIKTGMPRQKRWSPSILHIWLMQLMHLFQDDDQGCRATKKGFTRG